LLICFTVDSTSLKIRQLPSTNDAYNYALIWTGDSIAALNETHNFTISVCFATLLHSAHFICISLQATNDVKTVDVDVMLNITLPHPTSSVDKTEVVQFDVEFHSAKVFVDSRNLRSGGILPNFNPKVQLSGPSVCH